MVSGEREDESNDACIVDKTVFVSRDARRQIYKPGRNNSSGTSLKDSAISDVNNGKENGGGNVPEEKEVLLEIEKEKEELTEWIPDGGYGWAVVLGGVIVHIYVGGLMKASGVMYLQLKDHFNQSAVATAWVFSLFTTFLLMMGPIASALCHRFSCRTIVFFGSILCFVGILISAFAPNIEFLYFSYCVVGGFGRCLTYTPSLIIVTNYFNKRRGLAVGMTTSGVGLGMFAFPPMIEAIFGNYGYKWAMILLSAVSLQSFICAALFRPLDLHKKIVKTQRVNNIVKFARRGSVDARQYIKSITKPRHRAVDKLKGDNWHGSNVFSSTTEFTYIVPEQPRRKSIFHEKMSKIKQVIKPEKSKEKRKPIFEFSLLKDFPFLTLCLAILLFTSSMMSTFVFLPPLAKSKGVTQLQSAYLVSIMGAVDSIARFVSGFVLDLKRVKPFRVLVYNAVMFGVGTICMIMPSVEGFAGFAIVSACYGLFTGIYVAQKSVVVVDFLGLEKMTSSFGLLLGFQGVGSLIGPTISGLFRDVFGSYDEAFYFGGIGIFFGGFVLMFGNIYKIIRDRREKKAGKKDEDKEIGIDDENAGDESEKDDEYNENEDINHDTAFDIHDSSNEAQDTSVCNSKNIVENDRKKMLKDENV